jgi:hypothetical protein
MLQVEGKGGGVLYKRQVDIASHCNMQLMYDIHKSEQLSVAGTGDGRKSNKDWNEEERITLKEFQLRVGT